MTKNRITGFMVAIVAVGLVRFGLTVSGVPDHVAKYASMTVVIMAGCVYFGTRKLPWRTLLKTSYLLILPYMAVELAGIGYTWSTGRATIFHAPEYSFDLPIDTHFWGHLAGGLTWEPLSLFVVMLIVRTAHAGWSLLVRRREPSLTRDHDEDRAR